VAGAARWRGPQVLNLNESTRLCAIWREITWRWAYISRTAYRCWDDIKGGPLFLYIHPHWGPFKILDVNKYGSQGRAISSTLLTTQLPFQIQVSTCIQMLHISHYLKEWTQGVQVQNSHTIIPGARSKGLLAKYERMSTRDGQKTRGNDDKLGKSDLL
jgi:hypothetical protein